MRTFAAHFEAVAGMIKVRTLGDLSATNTLPTGGLAMSGAAVSGSGSFIRSNHGLYFESG